MNEVAFLPLELHEIASELNDIRKLGYHLGFNQSEIQRYEKRNLLDNPINNGTEDMLVQWVDRGGERPQLVNSLIACELKNLALRIERGEFLEKSKPVGMPQPRVSRSPHTTQGETVVKHSFESESIEDILLHLGRDLEDDDQVESLARALGFRKAEINRYLATNRMTGRMTSRGTTDMLYDWRSRVSKADQRSQLRAALFTAGLPNLADTYVP